MGISTCMRTLKSYRTQKRLTQSELSKTLGVTQATISKLENGECEPSLELAFKIEELTGGEVQARSWVEQACPLSVGE